VPFLNLIHCKVEYLGILEKACNWLVKHQIESSLCGVIIEKLYADLDNITGWMKSIQILNKDREPCLLEIQFLFSLACHVAPQVAQAIVFLDKQECFDKNSRNIITLCPEYALELAKLYHVAGHICKDLMLKNLECRSWNMLTVGFLIRHSLYEESLVQKLMDAKISHGALINLLKILEKIDGDKVPELLTQKNIGDLFNCLEFTKTLASAADCLFNVEKLDANLFSELLNNPKSAMYWAKELGGMPSEGNLGAKDYTTIRNCASVLFSQQRNDKLTFFPQLENYSVKVRGKNFRELQWDSLKKIAEFCGSGDLEQDTEHEIVASMFKKYY
jgi:hypothetical protein